MAEVSDLKSVQCWFESSQGDKFKSIMSIKRKVINQTIKRIDKRINYIVALVYANPLSEICQGRIKAQKILDEHKGDYGKIAILLKPLAREEKRLFALAKKQKNSGDMIKEQVKLENERYDLKNELFIMDGKLK